MKIKKPLLVWLLAGVTVIGIWLLSPINPPIVDKPSNDENFGKLTVSQPLWDSKGLVLVFADDQKFPATALGQRLAGIGATAVVIDPWQFFRQFNPKTGQCLDGQGVASAIKALLNRLALVSAQPVIVAGISEGALLPFLNAQSVSGTQDTNIAINFSSDLPKDVVLCPSLSAKTQNQANRLNPDANLKGHWRAVWTDQPPENTALFIKALGTADTRIAAYDTPLDTVLTEELQTYFGQTAQTSLPMPLVEVPAKKASGTLTIFYSGDGGWRDLDRTIADEMAALDYPVLGVDVLRYFWERKTPEQAATDLSATMAYYRKNRGVKAFVLAGYSFGADILPAVYNRLPQQDKDSIVLLALVALAKRADFEIHVSGWLGQSAGELPQAPELAKIPPTKILCIYGKEESTETACTDLTNSGADILALPGGHHFDQDYPKLTRKILDVYQKHGIN